MHYECRNQNYRFRDNKCPKFGKLVQTKTAANFGYECRNCNNKLKCVSPPEKRDSKAVRKISGMGISGRKPPIRKKSNRKRSPNKRAISKR